MRNFRLLFALLCFIIFNSFIEAQEGEYSLEWMQNDSLSFWTDEGREVIYYLRFKDAAYSPDMIPLYAKTIKLSDNSRKYSLDALEFETVPDSILAGVDIPEELPDEKYTARVFSSGGTDFYLDLNLSAIRRNRETGNIERLKRFSLVSSPLITAEKVPAQSKRNIGAVNNSLMASGSWYKIKVKNSGIYKLTYEQLQEMGFSDPALVSLFGHGGRQLSYWNSDPRPVDMIEIPVYLYKGSNGIFDAGDYMLFYAEGYVIWDYDKQAEMFRQKIHGYSNYIYYFLSDINGGPAVIPEVNNQSLINNISVNSYDAVAFYERQWINVIGSGRNFYSRRIDGVGFDTTFTFPGILQGTPVKIKGKVLGRNKSLRTVEMTINDQTVFTDTIHSVSFTHSWTLFGREKMINYIFGANDVEFRIGVEYNKLDQTDEAYLDYLTLNVRNDLSLSDNAIFFRDINSVGDGKIAQFTVKNATSQTRIWDITDLNSIFSVKGELSGTNYVFKAACDELHNYVAVNLDGNYASPVTDPDEAGVGPVENQNLRSLPVVDYIIIAPSVFNDEAERLADYRRNKNGLLVEVIDPELIYNEFSSGTPDISAIRDFFRHQYLKNDSINRFRYALLFGDGSYINHINSSGNTNYIFTFQSEESVNPLASYTSDDFYGLLDEGEGETSGKLDIGIGRFPVRIINGSDFEARGAVDKVISYDSSKFTDWRRRLCFVADDQKDPGGNDREVQHMRHADELAGFVDSTYTGFESRKVFLDAYPQVSSASGESYPDVNRELDNLFTRGILLFCYSGHGSENQITGELILQKSDVQTMVNKDVLPLFITATCQFGRYDHVESNEENVYDIAALTSAGEEAFLNPDGGAVALLTTSRVVYGSYNQDLVLAVLANLFKKDEEGKSYALGEVIMKAKNTLTNDNKLNFVLLGDPAMKLLFPEFLVLTDSINHTSVHDEADTLKAFGLVTISGYVAYDDSTLMSDFSGFVYPNVYDKAVSITTFGNDDQPTYEYIDQKNLIYKGKATVTNGRFTFSFVVPKDISYNIDKGKISYYAENGIVDAKGEFHNVYVGGTAENAEEDIDGPLIDLFMNNDQFEDGGLTNSEPYIYAEVYDENGINTTGIGIGHDIVGVLDESYDKPYVLNDYYEADADDYKSGIILYQLKDMEEGYHTVFLKVWDVFNNSAQAEIGFVVEPGNSLFIEKVINYPNPATDYTNFVYTHNAPHEIHKVELEVFDISGRLVTRQSYEQWESGFVSVPINWDFRNNNGAPLGPGLYPYRLRVTTSLGTASVNQKLIILR